MLIGVADDKKGNEVVGVADWKSLLETIPNMMRDTIGMIADVNHVRKDGKDIVEIFAQSRGPGDIMVRVGAAPDAIVADQAKSDGPINGPINKRVLQFVREHAGCKRADIANGIGVSLRSLKRALNGLSAEIQYRGRWKSRPGEDSYSSGDRGQGAGAFLLWSAEQVVQIPSLLPIA